MHHEPGWQTFSDGGVRRAVLDRGRRWQERSAVRGQLRHREGAYERTLIGDGYLACAEDPALLAAQFDRIGFSAYDGEMLSRCSVFLSHAPSVDFQFDVMPDGTLGDVFGLSLLFNEAKPREARVCMEGGYGGQICRTLQEWRLADERWRLIAGAAFAMNK